MTAYVAACRAHCTCFSNGALICKAGRHTEGKGTACVRVQGMHAQQGGTATAGQCKRAIHVVAGFCVHTREGGQNECRHGGARTRVMARRTKHVRMLRHVRSRTGCRYVPDAHVPDEARRQREAKHRHLCMAACRAHCTCCSTRAFMCRAGRHTEGRARHA